MNPNFIAAWMLARISTVSGLASLGDRVFPDIAKESAPNPCMVYQLIDNSFAEALDQGAATDGTIAFQVRIYADRRGEASALRESFRKAFQGLAPRSLGKDGGIPWRLCGSAFGDLADTHEADTKDYGALGVVTFHVARGQS